MALKSIVRLFASLRLTLVLLGLCMVLIFVGTLAPTLIVSIALGGVGGWVAGSRRRTSGPDQT